MREVKRKNTGTSGISLTVSCFSLSALSLRFTFLRHRQIDKALQIQETTCTVSNPGNFAEGCWMRCINIHCGIDDTYDGKMFCFDII